MRRSGDERQALPDLVEGNGFRHVCLLQLRVADQALPEEVELVSRAPRVYAATTTGVQVRSS
jgi:hypothetical protein